MNVVVRAEGVDTGEMGPEFAEFVKDSSACMRLTSDGMVATANPAAEEVYGREFQELGGKHWTEYIHPEDIERVRAAETESSGRQFRVSYRIRHLDGSIRHIQNHMKPVTGASGAIEGFLSVSVDITDEIEREAGEVAALQEEVTALQERVIALKVALLKAESFAGDVAHEIKNPITCILGGIPLLLDETNPLKPEERRGFLQLIARAAEDMNELIDAHLMLACSNYSEIKDNMKDLDMSCIFGKVLTGLEPLISKSSAEITGPKSWPKIFGFDLWVEEVLTNYISNAIKYGGSPPTVRVKAQTLEGDGGVRVSVYDNGAGLSQEQQALLFNQLVRLNLHPGVPGHGLGLAIVKKMIEVQGGTVGVSSDESGSCFWFELPSSQKIPEDDG